ncbi:MAG: hypothetical protein NTX52_06730 [Planctomycetota bacterium]|nr:hypothetical protein [Planctomycetota bacterium]
MKATKGLYQFFKDKFPTERKFYDLIPPLLEKKYLKTIYNGVSHPAVRHPLRD